LEYLAKERRQHTFRLRDKRVSKAGQRPPPGFLDADDRE
jgi:hypothetical protein